MLEVVIPGIRYGECIMDTANVHRGAHCYISGYSADGYQKLTVPSATAHCFYRTYPVDKKYFGDGYADNSATVDVITKGDLCIYYDGGEYITDQWRFRSFGFTTTTWAAAELTSTGTWGRATYAPGSSTAIATYSGGMLRKVFVCTGGATLPTTHVNKGVLVGNTAFAGATLCSAVAIGFVTGIYYKNSAESYLRYRIAPITYNAGAPFGGSFDNNVGSYKA